MNFPDTPASLHDLIGDPVDISALLASDSIEVVKRKGEAVTSDKFSRQSKQFLKDLDVRTHSVKKTTLQILSNILDDFRLPDPGEQIRIRTQQSINLISVILKMVDEHGKIDDLKIATYTLNKEASAVLFDLLKSGRIGKLSLYLASAYSFRDPEYYERLKIVVPKLAKKYDVHLCFAWLHFKITLARCGENFYQFEGSMNYSQNNMAEQLLIENSRETYEYDAAFIALNLETDQAAVEVVC